MNEYSFLAGIVSFVIGLCMVFLIRGKILSEKARQAEAEAANIEENGRRRAATILKEAELEAKDRLLKMKNEFDCETRENKTELKKRERRLIQKEEKFDKKLERLEQKINSLSKKDQEIKKGEEVLKGSMAEYRRLMAQGKERLEKISGLTSEEAKSLLIKSMEEEARHEFAKFLKKAEAETAEKAQERAKSIIATAIQRYAGDYVAERTVSVVQLPGDEMKGRIIGREGRNIRALEAATGVDLIIDDTPEAVVISGFNPIRREIARRSLLKLIEDGRIHPARIEDIVIRVEAEVDAVIKSAGEQAAFDMGVHGIHKELVKYIGRLKFRSSYTQNVLQHSVEVGFLTGIMAAELGLNEKLARRMGLLHDIGKGIDHEVEGPHALIGSRLVKKFGENAKVVQAIAAHHEDIRPKTVYDFLVQAADGLSGARPGARKEMLENYVKRLEDLEAISRSFTGVANAYAIQAGREVRVIVESDKVSDEQSAVLSRDIAKKIEENLTFPGQIRVTVIRETRTVEYTGK